MGASSENTGFGNIFRELNNLRRKLERLQDEAAAVERSVTIVEQEKVKIRQEVVRRHEDAANNGTKGRIRKAHERILGLQSYVQEETAIGDILKKKKVDEENLVHKSRNSLSAVEEELDKVRTILTSLKSETMALEQEKEATESEISASKNRILAAKKRYEDFVRTVGEGNHNIRERALAAKERNGVLVKWEATFHAASIETKHHLGLMLHGLAEQLKSVRSDLYDAVGTANKSDPGGQMFKELEKLSKEYHNFKELQFQEKLGMIREQQNFLQDMHAAFDEYRTFTEYVFNSESERLSEKLRSQMLWYDVEIKNVIEEETALYTQQLTTLDYRILGLVEGLDDVSLRSSFRMDKLRAEQTQQRRLHKAKRKAMQELQPREGILLGSLKSSENELYNIKRILDTEKERMNKFRRKVAQNAVSMHLRRSRLAEELEAKMEAAKVEKASNLVMLRSTLKFREGFVRAARRNLRHKFDSRMENIAHMFVLDSSRIDRDSRKRMTQVIQRLRSKKNACENELREIQFFLYQRTSEHNTVVTLQSRLNELIRIFIESKKQEDPHEAGIFVSCRHVTNEFAGSTCAPHIAGKLVNESPRLHSTDVSHNEYGLSARKTEPNSRLQASRLSTIVPAALGISGEIYGSSTGQGQLPTIPDNPWSTTYRLTPNPDPSVRTQDSPASPLTSCSSLRKSADIGKDTKKREPLLATDLLESLAYELRKIKQAKRLLDEN